ncbi:MAG: putative ABC transport system permease protein, partial [Planctomycetota bacterium]
MVKTLHIKVLRDLSRMRGQLLPIALILASGLGVFVGMRSTMHSLESARSAYYAAQRFGHVFARLVRAPEHVAKQLAAIPGVQRVQTRVVADVTLDIPGLTDAATGRLVSIPALGSPAVNDLYLVRGRMPR